MKNRFLPFLLSLFLLGNKLTAQTWSVHLNGNETYPVFNQLKGYYPILWYSSDDDRGILVGGFGAGVSYQKPLTDSKQLKLQLNGQRSRFYDQPSIYLDENGNPLGAFIGINTNLNASALGMAIFPISQNQKWLFGLGLGVRGTFFSRSDYGQYLVQGNKTDLKLKNKSLAPVVALLPIEFTKYFGERFSVSTRGEVALTKTSRLSAYKKERSVVVVVELGYRLTKK